MSQGRDWPSYVIGDADGVELFLKRNDLRDLGGRVSFKGLLHDTDLALPPTWFWYKLHQISVPSSDIMITELLWPTNLIAWGLNIWELDLLGLYRSIMQKLAFRVRESTPREIALHSRKEPSDICTFIFSLQISALSGIPSRFADFPDEDPEWRLRALSQMAIYCWRVFIRAEDRGFYDKTTGVLTGPGIANWQRLETKAAFNDKHYGYSDSLPQHKRKVEGGSESDQDGDPSTRSKKMKYSTPAQ
jgi:hypothetical protein